MANGLAGKIQSIRITPNSTPAFAMSQVDKVVALGSKAAKDGNCGALLKAVVKGEWFLGHAHGAAGSSASKRMITLEYKVSALRSLLSAKCFR
jgi:hypothetical protein